MALKEDLQDIREKLSGGFYQNEEHVRLSLVARVVQALGWDIWNPKEVNTEFVAVPTEDRTKVDVALFARVFAPSVFIEVKAVGGIKDLPGIERQLRDYNRNNTALFSIICDGAKWRFYYSQTAGEFSGKCFKWFDLLSDDLADVEAAFTTFLQKGAIVSGTAEEQAKALLKLTQKEKVMEQCLSRARHDVQEPPYPRLVDALVALVRKEEFDISEAEAEGFLKKVSTPPMVEAARPITRPATERGGVPVIGADQPGDLKFTRIIEAKIGTESARSWNDLASTAIRLAVKKGYSLERIATISNANLREGGFTQSSFHPVTGTNLSLQYMGASPAWQCALNLAKEMSIEITAHFEWGREEGAARPGQQASMRFP